MSNKTRDPLTEYEVLARSPTERKKAKPAQQHHNVNQHHQNNENVFSRQQQQQKRNNHKKKKNSFADLVLTPAVAQKNPASSDNIKKTKMSPPPQNEEEEEEKSGTNRKRHFHHQEEEIHDNSNDNNNRIGMMVYKDFGVANGGWYWGEVINVECVYQNEEEDEPVLYYRVHYHADGDEEDMNLDDLLFWNQKALEQQQLSNNTKTASASARTTTPCLVSSKNPTKKSKGTSQQRRCGGSGKNNKKAAVPATTNSKIGGPLFAAGAKAAQKTDGITAIQEEEFLLVQEEERCRHNNINRSNSSYKTIDYSMSSSLQEALNSSSPHITTQYLTQMLLFSDDRKVPGGELLSNLLDVAIQGPTSDDGTPYPDISKLNHVMNYLRLLFSELFVNAKSAFLVDVVKDGNYFWKDCLGRISEPYYVAVGDYEKRTNMDALKRIGESVHAKTCSIEVLVMLLEVSSFPSWSCIIEQQQQQQSNNDAILDVVCCENPIICDILQRQRQHKRKLRGGRSGGIQFAFNMAVVAYAQQSVLLGHFANDTDFVDGNDNATTTVDELLEQRLSSLYGQTNSLLGLLGKVCSHFARLYHLEEANESVTSLAITVKNIFYKTVEELKFQPPKLFLGDTTNEEHELSIKLSFVFGFDKVIAPPGLRSALADELGIAKSFNTCYGCGAF